MRSRSFTTRYRAPDVHVRRSDFPLAETIGWFLADKAQDVQDTTLRTYRGWLAQFCAQLPEADRAATGCCAATADASRSRSSSGTRKRLDASSAAPPNFASF